MPTVSRNTFEFKANYHTSVEVSLRYRPIMNTQINTILTKSFYIFMLIFFKQNFSQSSLKPKSMQKRKFLRPFLHQIKTLYFLNFRENDLG